MSNKLTVMMTRKEADEICAKINLNVNQSGVWLLDYRAREGWKAQGYDSFKQACEKEFHEIYGGRSQVYRLMQQSEVQANVSPAGDTRLPTAATRELGKLPPEQQREAYHEAAAESGGKPSTSAIKKTVEKKKAATPPAPKKPATPSGKYLAALERIGHVCGAKVAKAVKDGALSNVTESEAIFWASLKDDPMASIQELIVNKRWAPKRAHRFIENVPDGKTKISDLENLAVAGGGVTLVVTGSFATICLNYRKLQDEYAKIKKLLRL